MVVTQMLIKAVLLYLHEPLECDINTVLWLITCVNLVNIYSSLLIIHIL